MLFLIVVDIFFFQYIVIEWLIYIYEAKGCLFFSVWYALFKIFDFSMLDVFTESSLSMLISYILIDVEECSSVIALLLYISLNLLIEDNELNSSLALEEKINKSLFKTSMTDNGDRYDKIFKL